MKVSWSKLSEKVRNGIKILVGQAIFELLIKTYFACFDQYLIYEEFIKKINQFWIMSLYPIA